MDTALHEWITEHNEEALTADGFDEAVVGICRGFGSSPVVAYDRDKCIAIIIASSSNDDLTDEEAYNEAEEYFEFNIAGAYVGDNTPVFLTLFNALNEGDSN
jgi:hypothetical protein